MKTKHTVKDLLAFEPCARAREFIAEHKTLSEMWAICPRADWMLWALSKFNTLNESKARAFAVACAEHTLHFYEEKYPDDKRPRLAIEAARRCITDHSPESEAARSAAESAAWSAESDAWRAEGAAWSAAMSAAESAAWSAESDAMSAAMRAARSAKSAAGRAENKWQANKLREIFNPFECLCP